MTSIHQKGAVNHDRRIPLTKQYVVGAEETYIREAIESGSLAGGGYFTKWCEEFLQDTLSTHKVLLTSSCTAALQLAGQILGLGVGSEVIVPSFAFASCASVFMALGARIVFADSSPDTMNIAPDQVERMIGPRSRAILAIHYAGVSCDMDALLELSVKYRIPLIEDNAHGLFGQYNGRKLGTMGALGALSFDYAKNLICGEGGALLINEPDLADVAEVIYQRGTNRAQLLRGQAVMYEWVGAGGNYSPSELQAAFLRAQLEGWQQIQERRRWLWQTYQEYLGDWAQENCVTLPFCSENCDPAYHLFYIILPSALDRNEAIIHLRKRGVDSAFHYLPLHLSPAGRGFGGDAGLCPVVEDLSQRLLRLPFYTDMTDTEVETVVSALSSFHCKGF